MGLLIGSTLAIPYTKDRFDRLYPQAARVVDIQKDEIYLRDGAGNIWRWQGAEDWQIGDGAAMIMSNNGTKDIYDDIIVSIKYSSL